MCEQLQRVAAAAVVVKLGKQDYSKQLRETLCALVLL